MMLYVNESWIDRTANVRLGDSDVYETMFEDDELGKLYRMGVRENGRCISKVYIDGPDNKAIPVGWVFLKRVQYDDSKDTFLRETWVTVHDAPNTVTVTSHYHPL